jgi:hypothetical protein
LRLKYNAPSPGRFFSRSQNFSRDVLLRGDVYFKCGMLFLFQAAEIFEDIEAILNSPQKYQNSTITTVAVNKHGMRIERGRSSYRATKAAGEKGPVVRDDMYSNRGNTKITNAVHAHRTTRVIQASGTVEADDDNDSAMDGNGPGNGPGNDQKNGSKTVDTVNRHRTTRYRCHRREIRF